MAQSESESFSTGGEAVLPDGWYLDYSGSCPTCIYYGSNEVGFGWLALTGNAHNAPCSSLGGCAGPRVAHNLDSGPRATVDMFAGFLTQPNTQNRTIYASLGYTDGTGGWVQAKISKISTNPNWYRVDAIDRAGTAGQVLKGSSALFEFPSGSAEYQLRVASEVWESGHQFVWVDYRLGESYDVADGAWTRVFGWFVTPGSTFEQVAVGLTTTTQSGIGMNADFVVIDGEFPDGENCGGVEPIDPDNPCPVNPDTDWGPCEAALLRALGIVLGGGCVTIGGVLICGP